MMKAIQALGIVGLITVTGCASTDMEKRLEKNFVYQCSLKLFDELGRKVTGADAEKICAAAHKAEQDEEARKGPSSPAASPAASVAPTPAASNSPASKKAASYDEDEVKPESSSSN